MCVCVRSMNVPSMDNPFLDLNLPGRYLLPAAGVLSASTRSLRRDRLRRRALPEALLACLGGGIGATCRCPSCDGKMVGDGGIS